MGHAHRILPLLGHVVMFDPARRVGMEDPDNTIQPRTLADKNLFILHRAKRLSAPSRSLPRPRSRTGPFLNGSACGLVTLSDTTRRDATGARPASASKCIVLYSLSHPPAMVPLPQVLVHQQACGHHLYHISRHGVILDDATRSHVIRLISFGARPPRQNQTI
ncbi:hypothetical protein MN608_01805 [Microdochium nivale]|nr:hypothetical protein MN608_01805 [Microdochium nivale]